MSDSAVKTLPGEEWVSFGLASQRTGEPVLKLKALANSGRIRVREFAGCERGIELNELRAFLRRQSTGDRR